ncbi:MAG: family transcriptional regulator, cyclic receptor protein [Thermoleophilaceae bacterium]|jgi:CRP-like cAMP-binding protein|nr:family transcriptional regulator, cyclic receptor protein [Thermoleophilaceae bacterium]
MGNSGHTPAAFVRPFAEDPDLLQAVDDERQRAIAAQVSVPACRLDIGSWEPPLAEKGAFGILVIEGLLRRQVGVLGRRGVELLGAGDLIRPELQPTLSSVPQQADWRALTPTTVGILGAETAAFVSRIPGIASELLARGVRRSRTMLELGAITQIRGVSSRLLLLFWLLADRWGRRQSGEVVLTIPLTHDLLADLINAQRQSVSSALGVLTSAGVIKRLSDGTWVLCGLPPQTEGELALISGLEARTALGLDRMA